MIRGSIRLLQHFSNIKTYSKACISSGNSLNEKWDLFSAICLERRPIITPELNEIEREFKQLLSDLEHEKSLKSNYEVRHETEKKQLELLKKKKDFEESEVNIKQTAQELFDTWTDEFKKFKPADRITEADKKSDLKSLNRKLDKNLILVIRKNTSKNKYFILPQDLRQDGETLRQTADRVLQQFCGPDIKAQIYGNAPCGFYKYKYPKEIRNSNPAVGAKVFIYFARYLKGDVTAQKEADYKWLDVEELATTIRPDDHKAVSQFLIH